MPKKLSIQDILAQKEAAKQKKLATQRILIKSMDAEITIQEPTKALIMEATELEPALSDSHMVYHCIIDPNLKENHKELMKHFGCGTPYEIPDHLFKPAEVTEIAQCIMELAGYTNTGSISKLVDEIKN